MSRTTRPGTSASLRERLRTQLADLKMPGALEALDEGLVTWQHMVARAAGTAAQARLFHAIEGNADFAAIHHVTDIAALERLLHRLLHDILGPPQKPLTILESLAAWVQAAVDNVHDCFAHTASSGAFSSREPVSTSLENAMA